MKKCLNLTLCILLSLIGAKSQVPPQSAAEKEQPRIIDFGASLKPDFVKKGKVPSRQAGAKPAVGDKDEEDIIRVQTELVVNDVRVFDKKGNEIKGLRKEDFVVREDGEPQAVETFSPGDGGSGVPRSIVLILDYSSSMLPFIRTSVAAAKTLVDKLSPRDRMALVTDDVELLADFTRDKQLLKKKLDFLEKSALSKKTGRSQQYSALFATLNELFDREDVRPIIIFQTDGDEYGLLKGVITSRLKDALSRNPATVRVTEKNFSYADVLTAAERARATVYTIIPGFRFIGLSEKEQIEQARRTYESRLKVMTEVFDRPDLLARSDADFERRAPFIIRMSLFQHLPIDSLAKFSGGWADYLETPEQAGEVYSRVLADINSRYLIGYYPTNQNHDGKRRKIKIEVRGHPEYTVWGRKAYYAPEPE